MTRPSPRIRSLRRCRLLLSIGNHIAYAAGAAALLFTLSYLLIVPAGKVAGLAAGWLR